MHRALVITALALSLAACATFGNITPGISREPEVIAKFGLPGDAHQAPDGSRVLEYPRQPLGYENWRVTIAPDGTVRAVEQLVDEPTFASLRPGMSRDEVLRALGRPSETSAYPRLEEDVVSWRYMEFGLRSMFFNAHFDRSGRLKSTSRTLDPASFAIDSSM
jgi:hypothetical protein